MPRALLLLIVLLAPARALAEEPVTWVDHVAPIFEEHCTYCHEAGEPDGGLDLSSYSAALEGGASGEVIVPGDPGASRLLRLVTRQEEPVMPDDGDELDAASVATIRHWIAQGALETADSKPRRRRAPQPSLSLEVTPAIEAGELPILPLAPVHVSARPAAVLALAASPSAPLLAAAGHRQVLLFQGETRELLGVLPFAAGRVHALRFSRDGALLVAAGGEGARRGLATVWDVRSGLPRFEVETRRDIWLAVDLREDQAQLALGGPSRLIELHDTRRGVLTHRIDAHTDWVTSLAYSPDGVLLASGDRAGNLHVWESHGAAEFQDLEAHPGAITALAWRPDSEVLASACASGQLRLFRARDGKKLKEWAAHPGGALALAFARDGRLLSAGRDGAVRVWGADGKQQRAWKDLPETPLSVAVSADGAQVFTGDWAGSLASWRAEADAPGAAWPASAQPLAPRLLRVRQAKAETSAQLSTRQAATAAAVSSATATAAATRARRAEAATAWERVARVPEAVSAGEALIASLESAVAAARRLSSDRTQVLEESLREARVGLTESRTEATAQRAADQEAAELLTATADEAAAAAEVASQLARQARVAGAEAAQVHSAALASWTRWEAEQALAHHDRETRAGLAGRRTALAQAQVAAETAAVASESLATARRQVVEASAGLTEAESRSQQAQTISEHLEQLCLELRAAEASVAAVVSAREHALAVAEPSTREEALAELERARDEQFQLLGLRVASETGAVTAKREAAKSVAAVRAKRAALTSAREAVPDAEQAAAQAEARSRASQQSAAVAQSDHERRLLRLSELRQATAAARRADP